MRGIREMIDNRLMVKIPSIFKQSAICSVDGLSSLRLRQINHFEEQQIERPGDLDGSFLSIWQQYPHIKDFSSFSESEFLRGCFSGLTLLYNA